MLSGRLPFLRLTVRPLPTAIDKFIVRELQQRSLEPAAVLDDLAFLRRVSLDTIGQVPSLDDVDRFLAGGDPDRRARWIDRLLNDPRWADHWVAYWQDVLAENPNILKASLNNYWPLPLVDLRIIPRQQADRSLCHRADSDEGQQIQRGAGRV